MNAYLNPPLAFLAGLLSFLSPCVFPLLPSYLSFLAGTSLSQLENDRGLRRGLIARSLGFVSGFTIVFILLGLFVTGSMLALAGFSRALGIAAGLTVILLGLHMIFGFARFLNYEKKIAVAPRSAGFAGAVMIGMAFGAGWSPCVGPMLTSILLLAGQSGALTDAALYLALYSLGLGLPFIAAAVFLDPLLRRMNALKPYLAVIRRVSGVVLIAAGLSIASGNFQIMNRLIFELGYALELQAAENPWSVRVFFTFALTGLAMIPLLVVLLRRSRLRAPGLAWSVLCALLAVLNLAGLVDPAAAVVAWLAFRGI